MSTTIYWFGLSLLLVPYIFGYTLGQDIDELKNDIRIMFYTTAVSWGLLFIPINLYEPGWIIINMQQTIFTNFMLVIIADLLMDPTVGYRPSIRTICSVNSWIVLFTCIVYICSTLLMDSSLSSQDSPGSDGGQSSDTSPWIGTHVVDFMRNEYLVQLTLFVTIAEIVIVSLTVLIRRAITQKHLNPRYNGWFVVSAVLLLSVFAITLKLLPGIWGIVCHRLGIWSICFLCVFLRKRESKVYYAPLRSFPSNVIETTIAPYLDTITLPESIQADIVHFSLV